MPIVLKSWSLNLLEHSGPVQACNGIALPLLLKERNVKKFTEYPTELKFHQYNSYFMKKGLYSGIQSIQNSQSKENYVKGKAVPLQAWSGSEGSRKLRFPDFMTTAQDGGKVVSLTHRPPLPPGSAPGSHFC